MKQLVWINDGYSLPITLHGRRVLFRPLLRRERLEVLSCDPDFWLLSQVLSARVVSRDMDAGWLDREDWMALWAVNFPADNSREQSDASNLLDGVKLHRKYPHLTSVSCCFCRANWYDPETGAVSKMDGKPLARPADAELLCSFGQCPRGTPENPKTLSRKNQLAYRHYLECQAVGDFPDDPIVRRNAEIIREALKS